MQTVFEAHRVAVFILRSCCLILLTFQWHNAIRSWLCAPVCNLSIFDVSEVLT